jgi:hypothetical protein
MPAIRADQRRERIAISQNKTAPRHARRQFASIEQAVQIDHRPRLTRGRLGRVKRPADERSQRRRIYGCCRFVVLALGERTRVNACEIHSAATAPRFASILSMAETTASKVSIVDAWRAL